MGHAFDAEHVEHFAKKFERLSRYVLWGKPLELKVIPSNRSEVYRAKVHHSFRKQKLPVRESSLPDLRDDSGKWQHINLAQPLLFLPRESFQSKTGLTQEIYNTLNATIRIGLNEYVTNRLTNHPLHHNTEDSNPAYSNSFLVAQKFLHWLNDRMAFKSFMEDRSRGHDKTNFFEKTFFPWLKIEATAQIDCEDTLELPCQLLLPIAEEYCPEEVQIWQKSLCDNPRSSQFLRRELLDLCILGFCKRRAQELTWLQEKEIPLRNLPRAERMTAFWAGTDTVSNVQGQLSVPGFMVKSAYEELPFSEGDLSRAELLQAFVSFSTIPYTAIGLIHWFSHTENPMAVLTGISIILASFGMSWVANAHVKSREEINAVAEFNRPIIGIHEHVHEATTSTLTCNDNCTWIKVGLVYYLAEMGKDTNDTQNDSQK